ncbi:MAG: CsgG/HfaB family protein [Smithella sp.]|nr:CsgG/HfaB family protein [Smithella sp.]
MRLRLVCFLPFLFYIQLFAAGNSTQTQINIAVNDLSGKGIDQATAAIISDRLRSELISTGVFNVMERNEMTNVLKEQGFQESGACDEASCLVKVGQLLGVERMVAGTVGQIGTLYTLSLRMINVATGQIIFTVNEDYEGEIKGVLSETVGNAAQKLAAGAGGEIRKAALTGKTGDLYISSQPQGAAIEIDVF